MNCIGMLGAALIVAAIAGIGASAGWGQGMHGFGGMHGPWMGSGNQPGPSWMPHLGVSGDPGGQITQPPIAGAPVIRIGMEDFRFIPSEIRVKAGQQVNLQLTNRGAILHDLVVPTLRIHAEAAAGQQMTVGFIAPRAGVYEFYCGVAGHREAGMTGRLVAVP